MKRNKIAAGNWKMNTNLSEGSQLVKDLLGQSLDPDVDVLLCVPYTHLYQIHTLLKDHSFYLGAQNISEYEKGAYTGEISASMLKSVGTTHVIIGHSERRTFFGETNELLSEKLKRCKENGLIPLLCCGENLEIRKSGNHISFVVSQLSETLSSFSAKELDSLIIAYEPIWAIGTGETASPMQAQEMHSAIRKEMANKFGDTFADNISILYGGSVKPANAEEIFGQTDVDGGLVGGASLDVDSFVQIVNSFPKEK